MKQESFEQAREERWSRFAETLSGLENGKHVAPDFPSNYRRVCQDLTLARDRGFGASLVERLNALSLRGHQLLYGVRVDRVHPIQFLARDFPALVRREAKLFAIMSLLFYGTTLLLFTLDLRSPELIYSVLSADQVADFEDMYDPAADHYGTPRGTVGDVSAFAFYVANNVGVAFRTFAWGLFAGLGSVLLLFFNGALLGLVAAHISSVGYGEAFFPFVIGHGAFELTAIVLSGVCGMKLGWALVAPGRFERRVSLRNAGREVVPLLYGVIAMLVVAAVIEAFWSANHAVSAEAKLGVGAVLWVTVIAWLGLGGRVRAD